MSLSISHDENENNDGNRNSTESYQRVFFDVDTDTGTNSVTVGGEAQHLPTPPVIDTAGANKVLRNFCCMALLFSANHGCVVSCLALASSRLGTIGAWQSGILTITYAASALLGATYMVKTLGSRNAMILGMGLYCFYVGCFLVATLLGDSDSNVTSKGIAAYGGAAIGGIGAGFLWTAQGTYFGLASQDYSSRIGMPVEESNANFAGYFAFLYLSMEVLMRLLSSVLLEFEVASWGAIFGIYTVVAVGSTAAMPWIHDYPASEPEIDEREPDGDGDGQHNNNNNNINNNNNNNNSNNNNNHKHNNFFQKATVAAKLLRDDPKMRYMIGLNAVFGFVSAFLNSYVNGQVLPEALDDPDSKFVGVMTSTIAVVAAGMSLLFGNLGSRTKSNNNGGGDNNGSILILGALCFGGVVLPFVIQPDASAYGWPALLCIYALHGTGRATFEGTLRSTFADFFSYEKEGAFANIILQNGIASTLGYILTFALTCETPSRYCIEYSNGTLHDVWTFEFIVLISVVVAIWGYHKASKLHRTEQGPNRNQNRNRNRTRSDDDDSSLLVLDETRDEHLLLRRSDNGVST